MDDKEIRTGLDIDENYETLAVAVKDGDGWVLDIFQMPVGGSSDIGDTK